MVVEHDGEGTVLERESALHHLGEELLLFFGVVAAVGEVG
jgi:hypothetical protein